MDDDGLPPVPTRLVVVAYALALTCMLVPLGVILAVFVATILLRRGPLAHGLGVVVVALASTAFGLLVLA